MKEKIDTSSPEYKRQLAIVLIAMILLTALGGALLSYRITKAETKNAAIIKSRN